MGDAEPIAAILASIGAEFDVAMGRPERVSVDCARLRERLTWPPTPEDLARLRELPPLLRKQSGPIAVPLFDLLEEAAAASQAPWCLIEGMLASRDDGLARRALALAERLMRSGSLAMDPGILRFLAERVETEGSPLAAPESLARIADMLGTRGQDAVLALYLRAGGSVRRLAARLLDRDGQPVSPALAERVLGSPAHAFLGDYLHYTRASHLDLLHLVPDPDGDVPALASLQRAEARCGPALLRDVIAGLGWARVNLGMEVQRHVGVSLAGSLPLMLSPEEAPLLESCDQARRTSEVYLFIAHGGLSAQPGEATGVDPVSRFRAYNLAHAEVLAEILEVAPLTPERVSRILDRMDRIVEDFSALFASYAEEASVVTALYGELRASVVRELDNRVEPDQLSAELTRLVQSFEDPRTIGEVRTLHGLKRYLHQRGLRLGFRLVEAGAATNRTLTLVLASRKRILQTLQKISYVDFEPEAGLQAPYGVTLIAEGFARQLLHGQDSFPSVQIFCYGNEVHYYLSFRNHPAFLRMDYAPPLLGGMIDLSYYGVSVYELSAHPSPSLECLAVFLRRLEFDVQLEGTHVHARYDKERALDLGDLCEKARLFACLVPYLMDLDWIIGSLGLDAERRLVVAQAWADSFAHWGALPLQQLLTSSREGILAGLEAGPSGEREVPWSGEPPYRDRFRVPPPPGFAARLQASLAALGLDVAPSPEEDVQQFIGQLDIERQFLRPLREAIACGQLVATPDGLCPSPPQRFQRWHEAEAFAEVLASGALASAAHVGRLVGPLERTLRFRATGRVNGHELQRALLPLRGESLGLYVLRDAAGLVRLALFSRGDVLCRRRQDPDGAWESSWSDDPALLAALLRRNNYLPPGAEAPTVGRPEETAPILEMFRRPNPLRGPQPLPGERVLRGIRASPGRAVGTALFGTTGRVPEDFDGAVLVAPSVRPEDNTFLYHSSGIVSTGGGILSHAGLIATQFQKPALVVSGNWLREPDGSLALLYRTPEYREELRELLGCQVSLFRDWCEHEHRLREGDLVVLDAGEGTLQVLGQDQEALALHAGLRIFGEASRRLRLVADERETLALRGHRLRAAHQIRKLLARLSDPVLARHAAHELLAGALLAADGPGRDERAQLLSLLLGNPAVGAAVRDYLVELTQELLRRHQALSAETRRGIRSSISPAEVLSQRLELLRLGRALEGAAASLHQCGLKSPGPIDAGGQDLDGIALRRLEELRAEQARALHGLLATPTLDPRARHLVRQLERLDLVLGCPCGEDLRRIRTQLAEQDESVRQRHRPRRVVAAKDGGFELHSLVGWKAANLAEVERLGGGDLVPAWFVVTDRAFQEVFDSPLDRVVTGTEAAPPGAATLREAVASILARGDLDNLQKAARIRGLWEGVTLPEDLSQEVLAAYHGLARAAGGRAPDEDPAVPFVAIRSSAREEDAEIAARAGEFETFLFVRGDAGLIKSLKRAWSGLWTERAIHNRALLGCAGEPPGGGVIVQRVVWSRVSGVLQTVNVAEGNLREMVINAGLGLGEGIVSGCVEADHIVVAKEGDLEKGPLRFRYVTAEKREQVVFNRRAGFGTVRADCLYYQSLRPALEYVELSELVRVAARLEAAYGYPLDIEFGIEEDRLSILQARPVATFLAVLRETLERHPLAAAAPVAALTG